MAEEIDESQALAEHLSVVSEKIKLCREVLLESAGIEEDELLSSIVGFLEACRSHTSTYFTSLHFTCDTDIVVCVFMDVYVYAYMYVCICICIFMDVFVLYVYV